eukprot:TRINITY_DN7187_c0_g1_i1.p1 TRINITY_DN7187_c0_g1~~TRINITY_DN7187_c0_g1_i1.p1  ORF type:complete len:271 (+),score=79.75 TRINITY_DN7187_c0_g1_i1:102-914(+)
MYPGQTWGQPSEAQALRSKQVESLRQYFPTVKEVTKEALYEVIINLPTRRVITLRIHLPVDFPRRPPSLQIYPPAQHRFVDAQSFVTPAAHDNLGRWPVHANLGKTLYEIVQKLMQEPPNLLSSLASSSSGSPSLSMSASGLPPPQPVPPQLQQAGYTAVGYPSPSGSAVSGPSQPSPTPPQPPPRHQTRLPDIPTSFPELDGKTPAELTALINDEAAFQRFFEQLAAVQTMKNIRDDLRAAAEDLARTRHLSLSARSFCLRISSPCRLS